MKPYTWKPEHTLEETKNGAYWERNMLALMYAALANGVAVKHHAEQVVEHGPPCGWYRHPREADDPLDDVERYWEDERFDFYGWSRVISLEYGRFTFHVPDDFDLGNLPQIFPNWDGHSTDEKWIRAMGKCGIVPTPE